MNNWVEFLDHIAFVGFCITFLYLVVSVIRLVKGFKSDPQDSMLNTAIAAVTEDESIRALVWAFVQYRATVEQLRQRAFTASTFRLVDPIVYEITAAEERLARCFQRALDERPSKRFLKLLMKPVKQQEEFHIEVNFAHLRRVMEARAALQVALQLPELKNQVEAEAVQEQGGSDEICQR